MKWITAIGAWLATLVGVLGLGRAAAEGDRQHAHHPPLADEQAWAELVARLEGPTTWCATCAHPTSEDRLWCSAECQLQWEAS